MRNEVHRGGMVELVWPTCHIVIQFSLVSAPRQHTKAISLNQPSGEGWLPRGSVVKNLPANAGDTGDKVQSLSWEEPLKEEMATYSSILAWRIPWRDEPVGYSPWGHKRVSMTEQLSICVHIRQG